MRIIKAVLLLALLSRSQRTVLNLVNSTIKMQFQNLDTTSINKKDLGKTANTHGMKEQPTASQ